MAISLTSPLRRVWEEQKTTVCLVGSKVVANGGKLLITKAKLWNRTWVVIRVCMGWGIYIILSYVKSIRLERILDRVQ